MTHPDDRQPPDARQADALNAFLDDRARGAPAPRVDLDPSLAGTVHRLQDLAGATLAANVSGADEARTWEALLRPVPRPRLLALPMNDTAPASDPAARLPVKAASGSEVRAGAAGPSVIHAMPISRAAPRSRLRRLGSRSLGLVATLTLVALIGLSGLAVYLSAPRPDDSARLPLLAGASPTAETVPADSQAIVYRPCDVTPRDYDELMAMLSARIVVPEPTVPPSVAMAMAGGGVTGHPRPPFSLPDGRPVSPDLRNELAGVIGTWMNCNLFLRSALSTDDYLVRNALGDAGGGWTTVFLWLDSHPDAVPPAPITTSNDVSPIPDPGATELAVAGTFANVDAYGFRSLDEDHVAAYLASPLVRDSGPGTDAIPVGEPVYEEGGYVVLARQPDGRWLIDEWQLYRRGVGTRCFEPCATPVAP